jgi:hypothetical protein
MDEEERAKLQAERRPKGRKKKPQMPDKRGKASN